MNRNPQISEIEVLQILHAEVTLPKEITAGIYKEELANNTKLYWKLDPLLFNSTNLRLILNNYYSALWLTLSCINWLIVFCIFLYSAFYQDFKFLLMLISLPLLTSSGVLSFRIILLNILLILSANYYLNIETPNFWIFFSLSAAIYFARKVTQLYIEMVIIENVFKDFSTFWKYYSNKLIFIAPSGFSKEHKRLITSYPELRK